MVTYVFKDQQQSSLVTQKQNGQVKDRAIPAAIVNNEGDKRMEITGSGHQKRRAQEVLIVHSSTRPKYRSSQRTGKVETTVLAWDVKKVKPKSKVVQQAKHDKRPVHFASLMNFCHF